MSGGRQARSESPGATETDSSVSEIDSVVQCRCPAAGDWVVTGSVDLAGGRHGFCDAYQPDLPIARLLRDSLRGPTDRRTGVLLEPGLAGRAA